MPAVVMCKVFHFASGLFNNFNASEDSDATDEEDSEPQLRDLGTKLHHMMRLLKSRQDVLKQQDI